MQQVFEQWLVDQGYSLTTPSGNPSTACDYSRRVARVCEWENCSWEALAMSIGGIVKDSDVGGSKEADGQRSHRAVINALKRFREFCDR